MGQIYSGEIQFLSVFTLGKQWKVASSQTWIKTEPIIGFSSYCRLKLNMYIGLKCHITFEDQTTMAWVVLIWARMSLGKISHPGKKNEKFQVDPT